jgi:TfoX/Sxy family transcriptional regulator of competence genes
MAINEQLTKKIRQAFDNTAAVEEKKMFSGIAFMVNGKLCVSVSNNRIMCRVDPDLHDKLIQEPGCTTVVMKGRDYKGYIWVDESVLTTKKQINYWVKLALDFNPKAKATVKETTNKKSNKLR